MHNHISTEELWITQHTRLGQQRVTCPWCSAQRRKKSETCLSVVRDHETIKFQCFHSDCGVSGLISVRDQPRKDFKLQVVEQKPAEKKKLEQFDRLDDRHMEWLSARGISVATANEYDLVGEEVGGQAVVGFPYFDPEGNVVAVKKRFTREKKFLCWQSPQSFFGLRHIKKGDDFVIVEGEMDVLALAEAGVRAVSVPNGASLKVNDGRIDPEEDTKFKFLWAAREYIDAAKRVVIVTDSDAPGQALAEEIARRVGKERCWRVNFPAGVKDANDALLGMGAPALKKAALEPDPWPVQGLYDADHFEELVRELYDKGMGRGESTGYESVDELYTIVPGQVTVVTGIPSSGKSEFIDQIMVNMATNKHWKFGICSFENEPRLHIAKLLAKRVGRPFFAGFRDRMTREEYDAAFSFVQEHFAFVHQDDGSLADLDSILDRLRIAILRYGIRGAVIDPYNFISRPRGDASETEWISNMLTKVKAFAMGHGVHIWFVAHPTKLQRNHEGRIPVPGGYDISGSAAWFAKADCGLTVHREKEDPLVAQIHIWKCRFSWVGKQGQTNLLYDLGSTRYVEGQPLMEHEEEFQL